MVRVRGAEPDAGQAAGFQREQEFGPERFGLRLADIQADDLAAPRLMDRVRDHHALAGDTAAVSDLLDLRVNEQVGVAALQRALSERGHLLVKQPRDPRDLRARDPQPQALDELVDATRRDTAHIRLLNHRDERLLRALARLQEAREVAALAQLGDLQVDLTGPGVPTPLAITVAMRRAILGTTLTALGTDQL